MGNFLSKKPVKLALSVLVTVILVYAMIYTDVVLRARSAYLQGEKYRQWHENPALKKAELEAQFKKESSALEKKFAASKLTKEEFDRQSGILKFNYERKTEESSIKYAYVWYQTAIELFSPPESKWVKLSREKMPLAKESWKTELKKKNIPFEEYMLE